MNVQGKKIVVLGLGASGESAADLLLKKGATVTMRDSKATPELEKVAETFRSRGASVELGEKSFSDSAFDLAVLSPGIAMTKQIVRRVAEKGTPVIGELELASRFCAWSLIGITGTNGKSTTTELIAAILTAGGFKTVACGNIGLPMSDIVARGEKMDVLTVEISSFQLESIENFRPNISVYLNLTPDHLDRYSSMDEYRAAKDRIFLNQQSSDVAVINSAYQYPEIRARRVTFNALGGKAEYTFANGNLKRGDEIILAQDKTHLRGPHNAENQLAALAVADIWGVPRKAAIQALCEYHPLPHRCEFVRELDHVKYINDSKATNIDAVEKALLTISEKVVLIAGGKDKGIEFSPLKDLLAQRVRHVVLIGEMKQKMLAAWSGSVECHPVGDFAEAVALSRKLAQPGDVVLLSPGCSSYDMFENFEHRGTLFRQLVEALQ